MELWPSGYFGSVIAELLKSLQLIQLFSGCWVYAEKTTKT